MKRNGFLLYMAVIFTAGAYSQEEKTYLAIEERLRPLSLPRKTWKIDIGAEFAFGRKDGSFEFEYNDPNLMNFQFPYLSIGERTELYFFTPAIKFYPIKNSLDQDHSLSMTGPNFSIWGGITGIGFFHSPVDDDFKFSLNYGLGYAFKRFLGEKSWVFSNGSGILDLEYHWLTKATIGTGFQITDKFSIMTSIYGSVYEYNVRFIDTDIVESHIGYTVKVPIDFKINKKINRGYMLRTGFTYVSNRYDYKSFWGILFGLQYSWHW